MEGYAEQWKEDSRMYLNLNPPPVSIPHVCICHGRGRQNIIVGVVRVTNLHRMGSGEAWRAKF